MKVQIIVLLASLSIISCDDKVNFTYEDAVRNEIEVFFEKDNTSTSFHHDIENSEIEGFFVSHNKRFYIERLDNLSRQNKWKNVLRDNEKRIYLKNNKDDSYTICFIHFHENEVHLRMISF